MKAIVLPLTYFGNLSYYGHFLSNSDLWIDDCETYQKQTYRNRARILAANGPLDLTVPVKSTGGKFLKTDEIIISYAENWPVKHWRSIQSAYHSSPFFEEYQDEIKSLLMAEHRYLADLNKAILTRLLDLLSIGKTFSYSSEQKMPGRFVDFRKSFKPAKTDHSTNRKSYPQVFNYKFDFIPDLSSLDLLFNEGPYASGYLK